MSKFRLELVEAWLSQTRWAVPDDAGHCAAYAVFSVPVFCDQFFHAFRDVCVRASDGEELVYLRASNGIDELEVFGVGTAGGMFGCGREEVLVADRGSECDDFDAVGLAQVFLSYRAGCDSSCLLSAFVHPQVTTSDSPMVSRALLLPPPELALTPYFSKYVQSAWLGLG